MCTQDTNIYYPFTKEQQEKIKITHLPVYKSIISIVPKSEKDKAEALNDLELFKKQKKVCP